MSPESAPEPHALVPLTVFDRLFQRTTFVTGWLVEGTIDAETLGSALRRVTDKWRMLAGRVHSLKVEQNETKWFIRVPLGSIPADYPTYALTTETSTCPLSDYVPVPILRLSTSLPSSFFIHSSTPRQYTAWERTSHPLTCWHLTYFPASANGGKAYTAIGFARSHGVFDGIGAALITKALVAELQGKEWMVPSLPSEGLNTNPLVDALEQEIASTNTFELQDSTSVGDYSVKGYTVLGITGYLKLAVWHLWEKWWRGADRRILLLPKEAFGYLIHSVRTQLQEDGKDAKYVTSGDILAAWVFKTIYSSAISPDAMVYCTNVAAIRKLVADGGQNATSGSIMAYPHNAFIPIPYPLLSVSDLRSSSLPHITALLTASRQSMTKKHAVAAYTALRMPTILFPSHPDADDKLMISNVSASRILETDWSGVGAERTLCGYRYQLAPTGILFTNAVYIAGRLGDGSVVLDVSLNKARLDLLVAEVEKLVEASHG